MLSKRLEEVYKRVPEGARVADIGCDHAYLPIELVKTGRASFALGCDLNRGPLDAARQNAWRMGIKEDKLTLRLGNGLAPVAAGEVDTVTIAGMGAGLMRDILEASPELVKALKRIVVSPNIAPWLLRSWAVENQFAVLELYFGVQLYDANDAKVLNYYKSRKEGDQRLFKAWEEVRKTREDVAQKYDTLQSLWMRWEEEHPCK